MITFNVIMTFFSIIENGLKNEQSSCPILNLLIHL